MPCGRTIPYSDKISDLIGLCRSRLNKALPCPMQRKNSLLFALLIGTKRMVGRLTASQMASASAASFLLVFTYRLDELWRHQFYGMTESL